VKPIFKKKPKKKINHKMIKKLKFFSKNKLKFNKFKKFKKNHSDEPYIYITLNTENIIKIVLKKLAQY
jgi:hypothetical protein